MRLAMTQYFLFLMCFLFSLNSLSAWIELTDKETAHCTSKKPCYISHDKTKQRFKVVFQTEKTGEKLILNSVIIQGPNKKDHKYGELDNFQMIFKEEKYELFAVDLNSDGFLDLALRASRSLKLGDFYYYWVFNPKAGLFVQTKDQLEQMNVLGKNKLESFGSSKAYHVDAAYQIVPKS